MIHFDIKTAPKGKWTFQPGKRQDFMKAALMGMSSLYERINKKQVDSFGKTLPRLNNKKRRTFFFSSKDPRFSKMVGRKQYIKTKSGKRINWNKAKVVRGRTIFFDGGYAAAKRRMGKRGVRNLEYSGDMWRSLTPQVKLKGGDLFLRFYFARSSALHQILTTRKNPKGGRSQIVWEKKRVRNRTKAWWAQFDNRKGKPKFDLMRFSDQEIEMMLQQILPKFKLNGVELAGVEFGQHATFPRFN